MTSQDTPQEPEGADAAPTGESIPDAPAAGEPAPPRSAGARMQDAGARMQDAGARMQDATSRAADDLRGRSKRLLGSLSARSRGEGWEKPQGELAKYRSRWRAAVRFVLQRGFFGAIVRTNLTPSAVVHRRARTVRGPFVLVSNHSSHIDAPMLARGLPWAQARFLSTGVAADYFFNVWYKRLFVRLIFNAFPIDRGGSRKHSGTSRKLLRSGVPILVFPEGGRQQTGELAEFKPGAAALAIGVGVPVIPAAIVGAHEAMPKGRSWPVPGRPPVRVVFGAPMIALEDESAVDFSVRIRAEVKHLFDEHHDEVLDGAARGEEESA